ncbi:MAG: hypothetical protein H6Q70_2772 [Firmicutes bacterium]|nr:hypothetical protein [Bacillota bacterium]
MVPADFYLKDGKKIEEDLPGYVARNILEGFKNIDRNRPVVACHINNELFAIRYTVLSNIQRLRLRGSRFNGTR